MGVLGSFWGVGQGGDLSKWMELSVTPRHPPTVREVALETGCLLPACVHVISADFLQAQYH